MRTLNIHRLINGLTKYGPGSWSWIKKDAVLNDVVSFKNSLYVFFFFYSINYLLLFLK